jgi:hypothetical protein
MSAKTIKEDQAYAVERLLSHYISEGDTVYTLRRHTSTSGMSHDFSVLVASGDEITDITYYVAHAIGWRLIDKGHRAIRVQGGGMDMGFHLIYTLGRVLFNFPTRESDAGYALKHRDL